MLRRAASVSTQRARTVTSTRSLQGLMKWLTRAEWRDRFAEVYDHHLLPACRRTGLDAEEVIAILGKHWFITTVWGCAFEDFLTREGVAGQNIVDDYLKRRGWKEGASARAYMSALRASVMSLYEVSDIVRDTSFRVPGARPRAWRRTSSDQREVGNAFPEAVGPDRHARCSDRITDVYQRGRVDI
jgi:hypothetical protein